MPEPPSAATSCLETVQRVARHLGLSCGVARQLSLCRQSSLCRLYQHRQACYRRWCFDHSHSVSDPSLSNIADFLLYLHVERRLFVPTIHEYHSTLSSVFKFLLSSLQDTFILGDLVRSFELERPLFPYFSS